MAQSLMSHSKCWEKSDHIFFESTKIKVFPKYLCKWTTNLKNVDDFIYVGVTLDSTITFKRHIKNMCHVLKYNIANFRHIRNLLTVEASKTSLNAIFFLLLLLYIMLVTTSKDEHFKPLKS